MINVLVKKLIRGTIFALWFVLFLHPDATAGHLTQIDPYGSDTRRIPDITGNPGDSIILDASHIIDVLILGDGFLAGEEGDFLDDKSANSARGWYRRIFGDPPDPNEPGMRPFVDFKQAFRVRAVFEESSARANGPGDAERQSFYRVKLFTDGNGVIKVQPSALLTGWSNNDDSPADVEFRDSVFSAVDNLPLGNVYDIYPDHLDNSLNGEQIVGPMALRLRNVFVVMLVRDTSNGCPSGQSLTSFATDSTRHIRMAIGCGAVHEFGHAFGQIRDEYIKGRGIAAPATWINPTVAQRSVFNISNISFNNDRSADAQLWAHLAPGGAHNPKMRSLIGNLWKGCNKGEEGSWHSEYNCEINGTADNYACYTSDMNSAYLRDTLHYCFWCQEKIALRILDKTRELERIVGGGGNWNALGKQWWQAWVAYLREDYYDYFNYDSLIALKNQCYGLYDNSNSCASCESECEDSNLPACLPDCDIREVGNAFYADPSGFVLATGHKDSAFAILGDAISQANSVTPDNPLVVVRNGVQPGPITITTPVVLITDKCTSAILGQ